MPNIGDPLVNTVPAVGSSGTAYATSINAVLEEMADRLEAPVPLSSLQIGPLDMANNEITSVNRVELYAQTTAPDQVGSLQNYGGNLYWVSEAGAVQITTLDALNSAGIGGITGDYGGADPAQLRFVGADQTYYFYDDFSGGAWAHIRARTVEIAAGATSAFRVKLDFSGGASYTLSLPTAVPASQVLVQMDAAGDLTASNTIPSNTNITLQGTGKIVHGNYTMGFMPQTFYGTTGGSISTGFAAGYQPYFEFTSDTVTRFFLPTLPENTQLISISVNHNGPTDPAITLRAINHPAATTINDTSMPVTLSYSSGGGLRTATYTVDTPTTFSAPIYHVTFTSPTATVDYYWFAVTYRSP